MYRFHILDPIPFRERLRVSIEHGTQNDRADNLSSVALWYQVPPAAPFRPMPPLIARLGGEDRGEYLRLRAWQLATSGSPEAADEIEALAPLASGALSPLVTGLAAYAEGRSHPDDNVQARVASSLAELTALVEAMPPEERHTPPAIDAPTDPDALVPSLPLRCLSLLRGADFDLARRAALVRGLRPSDEILVEVRDAMGTLTPPPAFEATADWSYSYAKASDDRLLGSGAHFTYGSAAPSWARFTPDFPRAGRYEVLVIFSYGGNAGDTRWEVRSAEGAATADLPEHGRPGTPERNCDVWHSLGTYRFPAGQSAERGSVTLRAGDGTAVPNPVFEYRAYIDSARFVFRGE